MKKLLIATSIAGLLLLLASCNHNPENKDNNTNNVTSENKDNKTNEIASKKENKQKKSTETKDETSENESNLKQNTNKINNENESSKKNKEVQDNQINETAKNNRSYLNKFSSKEIEYARVWYQLISENSDLKGLDNIYVNKIPKGSKVNPNAKNSVVYKENVVKLEAPMKALGSITYSSNGDGTINVYKNIPYKWETPTNSDYSKMNEVTSKAIEDKETVHIRPIDNKEIAELTSKVKYEK